MDNTKGACTLGFVKASELEGSPVETPALGDLDMGISANPRAGVRAVARDTWWVGASDRRLQRFENAFPVDHGMAYNSYLICDEKTVLVDTADRSVADGFLANVGAILEGRSLDYVVVNHMEPDHSYALGRVLEEHPEAAVVCTGLAAKLIGQFFTPDLRERCLVASEGDWLFTGRHALTFVEAPWVHWPEVMMTFDTSTGVLFSADAFGTFGALDGVLFADELGFANDRHLLDEARRYYTNIVGKYGPHVLAALDKLSSAQPSILCPTHGPLWRRDIPWIVGKYRSWASYEPEDSAVVILYASVHGNTEAAAGMLADRLGQLGVRDVRVYDVSATHPSFLLAEAFRASHLVFASITYNNGIFTEMEDLIRDMGAHHLQNRRVSFMENGSWHATSAKLMRELVQAWPGMVEVGDAVNIRSRASGPALEGIDRLAQAIASSLAGDTSCETRLSDPLEVDTTSGASHH